MAWPLIIGMAASAIYSGVSQKQQAESQASINEQYATYNSQQMRAAADANARAMMGAATASAQMNMLAAEYNADQVLAISRYNADIQSLMGDYNAGLLEEEAALVWEAADLDLLQMGQEFARAQGLREVGYGASGVMMNQDTPQQALIDAAVQHEMDVTVVRHGADIQASKLLDSAARSRWEGNVAAQQIMYEGNMSAQGTKVNAAMASYSSLVQTTIDATMMQYNASVGADQTMFQGATSAMSLRSQGTQAMNDGLFKAGTTVAIGAIDNANVTSAANRAPVSDVGGYAINYAPSYQSNTYQSSLLA